RVLDCCGVDTHLVGAGIEQPSYVLHRAHATAHGQGNEDLRGNRLDDVQDDAAIVRARGDVQKTQLVRPLLVVAARDLDRISRVAQADEIDSLDHAAAGNVEARDDALGETH